MSNILQEHRMIVDAGGVLVKRSVLIEAAKKDTIFNAYDHVGDQVDDLTNLFSDTFDDWDSRLNKGKKLGKSSSIEDDLVDPLVESRVSGYKLAQTYLGNSINEKKYRQRAVDKSSKRASNLNDMLVQSTKNMNDNDDDFATSPSRAIRASRYENARAFYKGLKDGLAGSGKLKRWITTSDNPCEGCEDAEEEEYIPVDDTFENGLFGPLLHLNCQCVMGVK